MAWKRLPAKWYVQLEWSAANCAHLAVKQPSVEPQEHKWTGHQGPIICQEGGHLARGYNLMLVVLVGTVVSGEVRVMCIEFLCSDPLT